MRTCEPPKGLRAGELGRHFFQALPDALNRTEFRALRWSEHLAHVCRNRKRLGRMRPTVVQPQEIQARRVGQGLDLELEHRRIEIRQFQEEPVAGRGLHGPVNAEPLVTLTALARYRPTVSFICGPMPSTTLC